MSTNPLIREGATVSWCPGCGNFGIRNLLADTIQELGLDPRQLALVSGIGQAAKLPQYMNAHSFNGLHGRALPPATAIKASNPELTVIVNSGDGDIYGEGGNHFLHCIRRNPDITLFIHNNMVYGLTKGQASPTSPRGFTTAMQPGGVILEPFNPLSVAISLDASFVARAYMGHQEQTAAIMAAAISHRGFAMVDIFQPCVSFNKINTYQWFQEHTAYLPDDHDTSDRTGAFRLACQEEPLLLGIFYRHEKPVFEEQLAAYADDKRPLFQRRPDVELLKQTAREMG